MFWQLMLITFCGFKDNLIIIEYYYLFNHFLMPILLPGIYIHDWMTAVFYFQECTYSMLNVEYKFSYCGKNQSGIVSLSKFIGNCIYHWVFSTVLTGYPPTYQRSTKIIPFSQKIQKYRMNLKVFILPYCPKVKPRLILQIKI